MMDPYSYLCDVTDTDHDGSSIDNVIGNGVNIVGTAMGTGLGGVVGGLAGLMGGAPTGPGAALSSVGLGAAGAAFGGAVGTVLGGVGGVIGEDVGDEISDLLGTRGPAPYGQDAIEDPYYKNRPAGELSIGETVNQWITG